MLRKLGVALAIVVAVVVGLVPRALADTAGAWQAYQAGRYAAAAKEFKALAETGDATAQFYLGTLYSDGLAVKRDYAQAAEWYAQAAVKGHADAGFMMGFMYLNGAGEGAGAVVADPAYAALWLRAAAEDGNAAAQAMLAVMQGEGYGIPKDAQESFRWAHVAAIRGNAAAQYEMGLLKTEVLEVPSWSEAYTWFLLAERQGYPGAKVSADVVARQLDPKTLSEAVVRADDFVPRLVK
ncbi:MAG: sel1 repeat family protein [Alphaproteobacteria bacterium]|nr:sel1 repeat family protein [Alphaproteobacteria bacterium]